MDRSIIKGECTFKFESELIGYYRFTMPLDEDSARRAYERAHADARRFSQLFVDEQLHTLQCEDRRSGLYLAIGCTPDDAFGLSVFGIANQDEEDRLDGTAPITELSLQDRLDIASIVRELLH